MRQKIIQFRRYFCDLDIDFKNINKKNPLTVIYQHKIHRSLVKTSLNAAKALN